MAEQKKSYNKFIYLNYISIILSGFCVLGIQILVGIFYPPDALGVFNQALSIYMIFSQFAALGIHLSVLKYTAEYSSSEQKQKNIISSGFFASILTALPCSLLLYFSSDFFGIIFNSIALGKAMTPVCIGIFFFALNKALLATINSLEWLTSYAYYTSLRYILLVLLLGIFINLDVLPQTLFAIFPLAEGILCILLIISLRNYLKPSYLKLATMYEHISFGLRAVGGHIMLELNMRVDILCLGIFLDDAVVGIYSMAATLAGGACQLPIVLRTVYNPRIIQLLTKNDHSTLSIFIKKIRNYTWIGMTIICSISVLLYPYIIPFITNNITYAEAQPQFAILLLGVTIASGYMPLSFLFINAGLPGKQTYLVFLMLISNLIANLALIPYFGLYGAAMGTCTSYVIYVILLRVLAKKYILLKI